ncbi:MAG TPA: hypothetical protein VGS62_09650 [Streptosporangiaceae bacterium]|nr:hypothetical protein [Streptosporangiaceae bacterium]
MAAFAGISAAAASTARGTPPPVTRLGFDRAGAMHAAGSKLYTDFAAGYDASGGRFFRFVTTTVTVPAASTNAPASAAVVALSNNSGGAELFVNAGGGSGSVGYNWTGGSGVIALAPNVGDQLTISIYFNQHGRDLFTAADTTTGNSVTVAANVGSPIYTFADVVGAVDNSQVTAPATDTRLWAFASSHLTTYSGARGTLQGPWVTSEVVDTLTGTPSGAIVTDAPVLYNSGQNFGVWLRTTA